jgi:hypothetical protein
VVSKIIVSSGLAIVGSSSNVAQQSNDDHLVDDHLVMVAFLTKSSRGKSFAR